MGKKPEEDARRRIRIQARFWSQVGSAEHINLPKLEDAVRKEFGTTDDRLVEVQVRLMQAEGRVRVQEKAKVWINQPEKV
jgi:hypothetical protein